MRQITKGAEPRSLTAHRQTAHCSYENYEGKDALRHALVTEQRGLCCYCMSRIHNGSATMKIEHWHCRRRYKGEQLVYKNLLGSCPGGESLPRKLQHCDTRKGKSDIRWNPADPSHHVETRIWHGTDGSIRSHDPEFDRELNEVLNLNLAVLRKNRKGVLDVIIHWWRTEKGRIRGPVPRASFERRLERCIGGAGDLQPFSPVMAFWLRRKLAAMNA